MDTADMRQLLTGYLNEIDWSGGASKERIVNALALRDRDLLIMVNQYITEGTYRGPGDVLNLIPEQAWQAGQGDDWRGAVTEDPEAFESNFTESPVGQMEKNDVYHKGGPTPKTSGFGEVSTDARTVRTVKSGEDKGASAAPSAKGDRPT